MESWDKVKFQFCNGMVHFFDSVLDPQGYSSLSKLFSLGNAPLVLVEFSELAMHGLDCRWPWCKLPAECQLDI